MNTGRIGLLMCSIPPKTPEVRNKTQSCEASGYRDTEGNQKEAKRNQDGRYIT